MSFIEKFFKKLQQQPQNSFDNINFILYTSRDLSEEQKNTIKSIVKDGLKSKLNSSEILKKIDEETGIYSAFLFFSKDENGSIEIYF